MNARTLKLSKDVNFPLSLVTASGVIYGGKGMGKSSLGIGVIPEELDRAGLLDENHEGMGLTSGGQDQCHQFLGIAQSVDEVRSMWQQNLGGTEWKLLNWLIQSEEQEPERYWTRDEVAVGIGLSTTSGHYTNVLSALRRNGLLEEQGSTLRVTRSLLHEVIAA